MFSLLSTVCWRVGDLQGGHHAVARAAKPFGPLLFMHLSKTGYCLILSLGVLAPLGRAVPAWVAESDANANILLTAIAKFEPEQASSWGLTEYDAAAADHSSDMPARFHAALKAARDQLADKLGTATEPHVRQDLEIMIDAAEQRMTAMELDERLLLPYLPVGRAVFQSEFALLNDQAAAGRHAAAVERLHKLTGLAPNSTALAESARARYEEKLKQPGLLPPFKGSVEQDLANGARYAKGVRELFAQYHLEGEDAVKAFESQLAAYDDWVRTTVLPNARTDAKLPAALYAQNLRQVGLDITPQELIRKAELAYSEIVNELQTLAPLVARRHGWPETDYRDVVRRLKAEQLAPAEVEAYFRQQVIPQLESLIREHRVATLPDRPMAMRVASEAESAAQPAPRMKPPRLIGNQGERGTFVLPLGNPPQAGGKSESYDDFTFKAGAWTLTAHEGRPGHELQFSKMVELGVSQARSIFAFNSVNVEGWALYAEAEMKPYEPLDGQLIALQLRLLRAVRAIADPMLNLGMMTRERAHELLVRDVGLSEAFAREELDRFMFRTPGQATAYFYGYTRIMELRGATQVALGAKFDRLAFNDFLVSQGLLPPRLLAAAVQQHFRP